MSAVQDHLAGLAQQSQDVLTGALRTWAQTTERMTGLAGGSGLPGVGAPDLTALVTAGFDLAEQVLGSQREVTLALVRALTSVLPGAQR